MFLLDSSKARINVQTFDSLIISYNIFSFLHEQPSKLILNKLKNNI